MYLHVGVRFSADVLRLAFKAHHSSYYQNYCYITTITAKAGSYGVGERFSVDVLRLAFKAYYSSYYQKLLL